MKKNSCKEYKMIRVNRKVYNMLKDSKEYSSQSFNSLFFNKFKKSKKRR